MILLNLVKFVFMLNMVILMILVNSGYFCDSCYSHGYGDSGASGNSCDDI